MAPTRISLAPATVTALQHTGPGSAEEIRALAEASTTRRPAFLPPLDFEQARVHLDEQRSWMVVVPSGALLVLSPDALASIRPASAVHGDRYDHIRPGRRFAHCRPGDSTVLVVAGHVNPYTATVEVTDTSGKRRPVKADSLRPPGTKPNGDRYLSGYAPADTDQGA
ncbi:hypothetical protein [Nocardiopsis synnemataformans]|uniref:hypothetical protein n=1 Tax=Nocardiopsis synnemataformans TaxID=61305 RepID=UPI003EB72F79